MLRNLRFTFDRSDLAMAFFACGQGKGKQGSKQGFVGRRRVRKMRIAHVRWLLHFVLSFRYFPFREGPKKKKESAQQKRAFNTDTQTHTHTHTHTDTHTHTHTHAHAHTHRQTDKAHWLWSPFVLAAAHLMPRSSGAMTRMPL